MIKLRSIKTALLNDLDDCKYHKAKIDFDTQFPELMILTVKEKLIKDFIDIIKKIIICKNNRSQLDQDYLLNKMIIINKRLKIHLAQLEKLRKLNKMSESPDFVRDYYKKLIKLLYNFIFVRS